MSRQKELNFFVAEANATSNTVTEVGAALRPAGNWSRGIGWYEHQFAPADGALAIGEASPRYAMDPFVPGVPQRMVELLPDTKLIYLVREPIKRMVSHYLHRGRSRKENRSLESALTPDSVYFHSSRYAHQVEQYLAHFRRSQLLVVVSERLLTKREATMAKIFDFIGVDTRWSDASLSEEHHVTSWGPPRGATRSAMSIRWWNPVAHAVPQPIKRVGRRITHRPLPDPNLSPVAKRKLVSLLRDDVARLREYVDDEDFDGWGIA